METRMTIKFSDITGGGIPYGNNAGRPANPGIGKLYSNGEAARLELYTQASGWQNIVQETPGVSSITGVYSEQTNSGTITISGTNFVAGCYATAIGTNGVQVDASSTTFNSLVQVIATFTGLSNQHEPYDIKVTNPSNLFGMLPDALYINASPVWVTSSGSLGTFIEQVSITLSALSSTDSDSATITYALASGSTLPSGVTLNSSTGVISGTLPDIATDTTYSFTINASDGLNVIPRTFNIVSLAVTPTVEYLVVGGGGGGGVWVGSGGGAGGLLAGTLSITSKSLPITVGAGGIGTRDEGGGGSGPYVNAEKGGDSILSTLTAFGGGVGGSYGNSLSASTSNGGSGGGAMQQTGSQFSQSGTTWLGGVGTSGQGHAGGNYIEAALPTGSQYVGAGGGGAGSAGSNASSASASVFYSSTERKGGDGLANSITGTSIVYAGGGGGGANSWAGAVPSTAGLQVSNGGSGGGGAGWTFTQAPTNTSGASIDRYNTATNGTNGLGGGGGGVGWSGPGGKHRAGNGGSGTVIIAYPDTKPAITTIPGTLTYDQPTRAGYRVYRFTAGSGTITF
jgi:hypothetical protein